VLRPDIPRPEDRGWPVAELVRHPDVQPNPQREGQYFIPGHRRAEYLEDWLGPAGTGRRAVPRALRTLSARLADYYRASGREGELEVLYHLVAADPRGAARLFEDLYGRAEDRFDLARCRDLLVTLEEREPLLNEDLQRLVRRYRTYLDARTLWAPEYYRTVPYQERDAPRAAFDALAADPVRWVLHLHAPGGLGKSMFLHWLLARYCAPRRLPAALIDFDRADVVDLAARPWFLLLRLAEQLARQVPGSPFDGLLADLSEYRRPGTTPPEGFEAAKTRSFAEALRGADLAGPAVLVFDTLEDAQLHQPKELLRVIQAVANFRPHLAEAPSWWDRVREFVGRFLGRPARRPRLLLVLAGRYNLLDDPNNFLPGFKQGFGDQVLPLLLEEFKEREAHGYLTQKRGLEPGRAVDAALARAGGNPFKLALYADLLWEGATAEEIEADQTVDEAYLIERIIQRIKDEAVRWLLQYGVVPRRLTRDFVERVMIPAMPGSAPAPAPAWGELKRYASRFSWVEDSGPEPDALRFKTYVIAPRRRLLEAEEPAKYRELHERAAAYFAAKLAPLLEAAEPALAQRIAARAARYFPDPLPADAESLWPCWARELVYHLFQCGDLEALAVWQELLQIARRRPGSEARAQLAQELTLPEYGSLVGPLQRARAYLEEARALVERAREDPIEDNADLWIRARNALGNTRELGELTVDSATLAEAAWLEGALLLQEDSPLATARALEALQRPLPEGTPLEHRLSHALLTAEALSRLGLVREAVALCEETLNAAERERKPPEAAYRSHTESFARIAEEMLASAPRPAEVLRLLGRVCLRLGELYESQGQFGDAAAQYDTAARLVQDESDPLAEWEARLRAFQVGFWTGQLPSEWRTVPPRVEADTSPRGRSLSIRWRLAIAEIELGEWEWTAMLSDAREAVRLAERLTAPASSEAQPSRAALRLLGEARLLLGRVLAELMEFAEAVEEMDGALAAFRQAADQENASRVLGVKADFLFRGAGDLNEARNLTRRLQASSGARVSLEAQRRAYLLELELSQRSGVREASLGELDRMLQGRAPTPPVGVEVALTALAVGHRVPLTLDLLLTSLRDVGPAVARLRLVDRLSDCVLPADVSAETRAELAALFPEPETTSIALRVARAEVLRVAGDMAAAEPLLRRALEDYTFPYYQGVVPNPLGAGIPNALGVRKVLEARDRLGLPDPKAPAPEFLFESIWSRYKDSHRGLSSALLLQQAKRLFRAGAFNEANANLGPALPALEAAPRPTRWLAEGRLLAAQLAWLNEREADALKLKRQAADLYQRLGDTVAAGQVVVEKDAAGNEWGLTVRVTRVPDGVAVETRFAGRESRRQVTPQEQPLLGEVLRTDFLEVPDRLVERFVRDHVSLGEELRGLVLPDVQRTPISTGLVPGIGRPLDVALDIGEPALAALPWEFLSRPQPRWPLALDEGAVRYFHRENYTVPLLGEPPAGLPTVLGIEPSAEWGPPSQWIPWDYYHAQGFKVEVLPSLVVEAFQARIRAVGPSVIHLCGEVYYSTTAGGAYIHFPGPPGGTMMRYPTRLFLTASELKSALLTGPDSPLLPLVILDSPRPASLAEAVRQLVRRNALAAELYGYGVARAVLATGLARPADQERLYKTLAKGLAEGWPLGKIAATIHALPLGHTPPGFRRRPRPFGRLFIALMTWLRLWPWRSLPSKLDDLLAFLGTALFTRDPTSPAFTPSSSGGPPS
jgi:hypothetical protein